ncbi:SRPBCC family protein [Thiocapsa rosea]|uniref:DNA gyrase inhibitor GyrI n=1 Tax=Thiocapsa rosea TaxID=69360 RepID=A0A495V8J0_9GAMM|nr:GyrI-like domain-containing protein [Thiocapsa rosea]RKT44825.1 DNA gyrase inhibitor GyrI [Thiocapsa rosea]
MLYLLLLPPLIIIAAVIVHLATLPATFAVERSRLMMVDRQRLFDAVRDLGSWKAWSPWLLHEPEAELTFSDAPDHEGGSSRWDGKHIGAGSLTQMRFQAPDRIDQRLVFRRPFKARCDVWWEFKEQDGCTLVTWGMQGRMPFGLRFMVPTMSHAIAKDYELGLALLNGYLDPSASHPEIRFVGPCERAPRKAVTIPFSGSMEAMVAAMEEGFPSLAAQLEDLGITPAGAPFTVYHKVDAKAGLFVCDLAMPIPDGAAPGELVVKEFPGGRYFLTELRGSYDFLESTWHSLMAHLRMCRIKQDPSRPSLEVYAEDPRSVGHENEILTQIFIPIHAT